MIPIWILSTLVAAQPDMRAALPPSLQRVVASDRSKTSEIHWTMTHLDETNFGLVENYITRTAAGDLWQANLGGEGGVHRAGYRHPPRKDGLLPDDAVIPPEELAGPRHTLLRDGSLWYVTHHRFRPPETGDLTPQREATAYWPFDFAAAGLAPWWYESTGNTLGLQERFVRGFEHATFSRFVGGTIETVSASYDGFLLEWQLDRRQGGKPVSAALYQGDEPLYRSETDWREEDGRWLPATMRYFFGPDDQPQAIIEVQDASFDKPSHQQEFTPEDLGVLFGTQLLGPDGVYYWDGQQTLTTDEYYDLIYLYGLRPDPYILECWARSAHRTVEEELAIMDEAIAERRERYFREHGDKPWLMTKAPGEKDEWDLYVEAFIKKHEFDEPRVKRAHDLLDQAKKLRDHYRRKNKGDQRKAEEEGDTAKLERIAAIEERIFNRVLKRGLEKLLPRKERPKSD